MADSKVSALTTFASTLAGDEWVPIVDDPSGTPVTRKIAAGFLGAIRVYKTADETINNSTTFQDDDHLQFTIGASEKWLYEINGWVQLSSGSAGGPKMRVVGPASSVVYYGTDAKFYTSGSADAAGQGYSDQTTALTAYSDNILRPFRVHGYAAGGGTAGLVKLQWAQNAATAVNTQLRTGAWLFAMRLA